MNQETLHTTTDVEKLLNDEFLKFQKKWHGVINQSDLQTLAKYIEQVKDS